jgi:hypothetical protein
MEQTIEHLVSGSLDPEWLSEKVRWQILNQMISYSPRVHSFLVSTTPNTHINCTLSESEFSAWAGNSVLWGPLPKNAGSFEPYPIPTWAFSGHLNANVQAAAARPFVNASGGANWCPTMKAAYRRDDGACPGSKLLPARPLCSLWRIPQLHLHLQGAFS